MGTSGMTVLPIVARELRVASRRRATYWSRTLTVGVAVAIFGFLILGMGHMPHRQMGQTLFWSMGFCFFWVALMAGLHHTADCLSSEKRGGTLGLLFLTPLTGWDVVLGKLAATSLNASYGLTAILPVLAVPLLMGGVTVGEFGRFALMLLSTLFFSLSAGVLASAWSRQPRAAAGLTLLFIVTVHGLGPLLGALQGVHSGLPLSEIYLMSSVGYAAAASSESGYSRLPEGYWISLAITLTEACMVLWLAAKLVRTSWQEKVERPYGGSLRKTWRRVLYGDAATQHRFRCRLLDRNACLWLSGRHRYRPWMVWGTLGLVGLSWVCGYIKLGDDWLAPPMHVLTALCLHLLLTMWMASDASQMLGPDYRSGALELVLGTSMGVRPMLQGHMAALRRQFLGPTLTVMGVDVALMMAGAHEIGGGEAKVWNATWLCVVALLPFNLVVLAWIAMWRGIAEKRSNRAPGSSFALVMLLPWFLLVLLTLAAGLARVRSPIQGPYSFLGGYVFLQVLVNVIVLSYAMDRLTRTLRSRLALRFGEGLRNPMVLRLRSPNL